MQSRRAITLPLAFLTLSVAVTPAFADDARVAASKPIGLVSAQPPAGTLDISLRHEVDAAANRGLDWLVANQKDDGSWSNGAFPALTALPVWALIQSEDSSRTPAIKKGIKYILSMAQDDGGIYKHVEGQKGGGLSNYNTAICMTVLYASGDKELIPIILKAREFVSNSQHLGDDVYSGGFGYDASTGRAYTDLLNTFYSVQAMSMTAGAEDLRPAGQKRVDIDWSETIKFIERMQNAGDAAPEEVGGFFYNPTDPKAGTVTNSQGVVTFRSYGSITYAGMLSLIYSNLSTSDHRVLSAIDWSSKHWTLNENPGMGGQGLYFFYNVLTRALDSSGRDLIQKSQTELIDWRREVAERLVSLQQTDPKTGQGFWTNTTGRFWESDPVLVTSYAMLALQSL